MRIIGITGPSGSGKTVLTQYLASKGIPTVDADALYHSMLIPPSECLDAIAQAFGKDVIRGDGTLDRQRLSTIVFNSPDALSRLNATVLPRVIDRIRALIRQYESEGHKVLIIDAPTLVESGFDKECSAVISVLADRELRIKRITARDEIDEQAAQQRVAAQKDDAFYESHSHYVLRNDSDASALISQFEGTGLLESKEACI